MYQDHNYLPALSSRESWLPSVRKARVTTLGKKGNLLVHVHQTTGHAGMKLASECLRPRTERPPELTFLMFLTSAPLHVLVSVFLSWRPASSTWDITTSTSTLPTFQTHPPPEKKSQVPLVPIQNSDYWGSKIGSHAPVLAKHYGQGGENKIVWRNQLVSSNQP